MKRKTKRVLCGALCFMLCFSMNISPTVTLATAIVESGIVDDLSVLKDKLITHIQNDIRIAYAEESSSEESAVTITDVFNLTKQIKTALSGVKTTVDSQDTEIDGIQEDISEIETEIDNIEDDIDGIQEDSSEMKEDIEDIQEDIDDINDKLDDLDDMDEDIGEIKEDVDDILDEEKKQSGTLTNIETAINTLDTNVTNAIAEQTNNINDNMNMNTQIITGVIGYTEDETLKMDMDKLIESLGYDPSIEGGGGSVKQDLTNIQTKLDEIKEAIEAGQHQYRVAHLYSMNNMFKDCLWKPYSKDVPYVSDFAIVTGRFANVYNGYWDSFVQTANNPGNSKTNRALEILGYDAIVRREGVVMQNNVSSAGKVTSESTPSGLSGQSKAWSTEGNPTNSVVVYYNELIPEKNITWLDAVTVLYKALGETEYTYNSFMAKNPSITPETSPAVQGLSGVTTFDGYDFYMFLSRGNVVRGTAEKQQIEDVYWNKAVNGGFVSNAKKDEVIVASDFFILASNMMQAYGEPVINDDEIKALLQVYGSSYPIQLGIEVADAWAYLKVRGILNDDINCASTMTREQLLNICMCIADEGSRSDYKSIQIILDIGDVYRNDGYFPVYDFEFASNSFESGIKYDHAQATVYHYLIPKEKGYDIGASGDYRVSSTPEWKDSTKIENGRVLGVQEIDGKEWYVLEIPKSYKGSIYLGCYTIGEDKKFEQNKGDVSYIEIPSTCLGGGFYTSLSAKDGVAIVNADSFLELDTRSADSKLAPYTDYKRAKEAKPVASETASNATVLEQLAQTWDYWVTPEVVYADTATTLEVEGTVTYTNKLQATINSAPANDLIGEDTAVFSEALQFYGLNEDGTYSKLFEVADIATRGTSATKNNVANISSTSPDYGLIRTLNRITKASEFYDAIEAMKGTSTKSVKDNLKNFINSGEYSFKDTNWLKKHNDENEVVTKTSVIKGAQFHYSEPYGTFIAQFVAGAYPIGYTAEPTGTSETTINILYSPLWTNPRVTEANTDIESKIIANMNKLITDEEDKVLSELLLVHNAKSVSNGYGQYNITSDKPEETLALLGAQKQEGGEEQEGELNSDLNRNVASSVIMNRDEQILIKWSDLIKSKTVVDTFNGGQPKMTDDGSFFFYTNYGQVKVNNTQHTIQIGTTLYDTMTSDNNYPQLYYVDNETGELYFDYRCVMGIITADIVRNDTETEQRKNSLGEGDYVIYDIGSNTNTNFTLKSFNCYNYPEIPGVSGEEYINNVGYQVPIVTYTQYDGNTQEGNTTGVGYWKDAAGNKPDLLRLQMNAFVPTANWIFVLDSEEGGTTGSLYVYYLRDAFENGFSDSSGNKVDVKVPERFNSSNLSATVGDIVNKILNINKVDSQDNKTIAKVLADSYSIGSITADTVSGMEWYDIMTMEAVADLYDKTGKYLIYKEYVVRKFDLTASAAFLCKDHAGLVAQDSSLAERWGIQSDGLGYGNLAGMTYWIDTIGMIYNIPDKDQWTLEGYLNGEWLLPIARDGNKLINYNMNSYGTALGTDSKPIKVTSGSTTVNAIIPYGCALGANGYKHWNDVGNVEVKSGVSMSLSDINNQLPISTDGGESYPTIDEKYCYPFAPKPTADVDRAFVEAPVGIYYYFGGNPEEIMQVSAMTTYTVDSNKVYYGTHQLKMQASSTQSSAARFWIGSKNWAPVELEGGTTAVRVHRTTQKDTLILLNAAVLKGSTSDVAQVLIDDMPANELENLLDKLGANSLIEAIDSGASWLIIIAFQVLPIIGIILMTILVGLSFVSDNKVVQAIADKTIDPVRILTFGAKEITEWSWRRVLFPCILLYITFALFLNGNIIRVISWIAKWYDVVLRWFTSL